MPHRPTSRRTVLKSILATGGAIVGISFMPEKWTRPVVRTGVLPVHAATSSPTYYLQGGYGNYNPEYDATTAIMTGIYAFVSYDDQSGGTPVSSGMVHGVANVPVILSWRSATPSDPDWDDSWASYTGTMISHTLPSVPVLTGSDGYARFDDQSWNYEGLFPGWYLTFASSACVNSPVEYY